MKNELNRKFWTGMVMGALVAAGLIVGVDLVAGNANAQAASSQGGKDVVLVRCKSAGKAFSVTAYQGSVATPARKTESCADTLGDLVKAGFAIDRAGYNDDVDFVVFTLTR